MYRKERTGAVRHHHSARFGKPTISNSAFECPRTFCPRRPSPFPRRGLLCNRFPSQNFTPVVRPPPLLNSPQARPVMTTIEPQNYYQPNNSQNNEMVPPFPPPNYPNNPNFNKFPPSPRFEVINNRPVLGHFERPPCFPNDLWIETAAENGRLYYYSASSRATQWVRPENVRIMNLQHIKSLVNPLHAAPTSDINMPDQQYVCAPANPKPLPGILQPTPPGTLPPGLVMNPPPNYPPPPFLAAPNQANRQYPRLQQRPFNVTTHLNDSTAPMIETPGLSVNHDTELLQNLTVNKFRERNLAVETVIMQNDGVRILNGEESSTLLDLANDHADSSQETKVSEMPDVKQEKRVLGNDSNNILDPQVKESVQDVNLSRPVSCTPVSNTKWCVIWTGDDRVFFYDSNCKLSVWEMPSELENRVDVQRLVKSPPVLGVSKKMETAPTSDSKKMKIEDRIRMKTDEYSSNTENRPVTPKTTEEIIIRASKEREEVPHDTRVKLFMEMLADRKVSAFSTWEKELHKIVFDPRYLLLSSKDRKQRFEIYVRDKVRDEKVSKTREYQDIKENYKKLLQEACVSSKTRFVDFARHGIKDSRFKAVHRMKDREVLFEDYVKRLRRKESRGQTSSNQSAEFIDLLKEQTHLTQNSRWSEVSRKIRSDSRFLANEVVAEKAFRDYVQNLKSNGTAEKEARISASIESRKEEVERDLSFHLQERDKERELHKRETLRNSFKALLIDLVRSPDRSWHSAKRRLKEDHRWECVRDMTSEEMENIFNEHVECLQKRYRELFRQFLDKVPDVSFNSKWDDVRKLVLNNEKLRHFSSNERKCQKEFKVYLKDKFKRAVDDYKELLKETKIITHATKDLMKNSNHLKIIEDVLAKDRRYLVLDCIEKERRDKLMSYIDDLNFKGPPPPPTATVDHVRRIEQKSD